MSITPDYLQRKLNDLSSEARLRIDSVIAEEQSRVALAGAYGGSRSKLRVAQVLERGFRDGVTKMAKFVIDIGQNTDPDTNKILLSVADDLASTLVDQHAVALFGSPAYERAARTRHSSESPVLKARLSEMAQLIVEDMQNNIVGDTLANNLEGSMTVNFVNNSPGAIVQQGHNGLQQTVRKQYSASLADVLSQIDHQLPEFKLSAEVCEDLRTKIILIQSNIDEKTEDHSLTKKTGKYIASILEKTGIAAAVELGKSLIQSLHIL